jgi:hypothetical protein
MSGFEVYDSIEKHIRGLQQRQQQQTEPGWYTVIAISSLRKPQSGLRLSARKTPATSTAIQNRTAGLSCQTSVTAMARCEFIHQIAKPISRRQCETPAVAARKARSKSRRCEFIVILFLSQH